MIQCAVHRSTQEVSGTAPGVHNDDVVSSDIDNYCRDQRLTSTDIVRLRVEGSLRVNFFKQMSLKVLDWKLCLKCFLDLKGKNVL